MPHFETSESYYQEAVDGTPDVRPPQLNEAVCGCRCGCGCGFSGESEGGSSDDEGAAARTQRPFENVPNISSADGIFPERSRALEDTEQPVSLPFRGQVGIQRIETRHGGFIMSREGFRPDHFAVGSEDIRRAMFARRQSAISHAESETLASTTNEPHDGDDHSSASGGEVLRFPDVRCGSPGPGVGGWVAPADYYFVKSPLRLTAQRQYCRGLVAAHLIVHDDTMDHEGHDSVFAKRLKI